MRSSRSREAMFYEKLDGGRVRCKLCPHFCVIADGKDTRPTEGQIKRVQVLVEGLCRQFHIRPESVYYPLDWR